MTRTNPVHAFEMLSPSCWVEQVNCLTSAAHVFALNRSLTVIEALCSERGVACLLTSFE